MKKVLQSFLSCVTSRISFVMLRSRPATGGTRRKSKILRDRDPNRGVTFRASEHSLSNSSRRPLTYVNHLFLTHNSVTKISKHKSPKKDASYNSRTCLCANICTKKSQITGLKRPAAYPLGRRGKQTWPCGLIVLMSSPAAASRGHCDTSPDLTVTPPDGKRLWTSFFILYIKHIFQLARSVQGQFISR